MARQAFGGDSCTEREVTARFWLANRTGVTFDDSEESRLGRSPPPPDLFKDSDPGEESALVR